MKILDLFFPRQCLGCKKTGAYLCKDCKKKLQPHMEICPFCHKYSTDYVRSLDGLFLKRALRKDDIHLDKKIREYMGNALAEQKKQIIESAIETSQNIAFHYVDLFGLVKKHQVLASKVDYFEFADNDFLGVQGHCFESKKEKVFAIGKMFDLEIIA